MSHNDPHVLALMICELVIEDAKTRNKSLVNTFNAIRAPKFPMRHDRMFVFLQMTGGRGKIPVVVELLDPDNQPLLSIKGEPDFKDPTGVHDAVFELRGTIFKKKGLHRFEVRAGESTIADRPFNVIEGD